MGQVIALVNQKGGVGKTTTAVNLSHYLTSFDKKVLLVDLDPQANATSGVGFDRQRVNAGVYDVVIGRLPAEKAIFKIGTHNYDLMPSSVDLAGLGVELVSLPEREFWLYKALRPLRDYYDYIFIDSPPSLDLLTVNGLVASDGVMIPVQCEYYALEGLSRLLETVAMIRRGLKPNLEVVGAVLTMFDRRNKLGRQVVKEVKENFPGYVFETIIPRNVKLSEAPSFGKSILSFDHFSKGARAYGNLARELLKLEERGFWSARGERAEK